MATPLKGKDIQLEDRIRRRIAAGEYDTTSNQNSKLFRFNLNAITKRKNHFNSKYKQAQRKDTLNKIGVLTTLEREMKIARASSIKENEHIPSSELNKESQLAVSGMKEGVAAPAAPVAPASDSQMFPVKIRSTLSQGDCFYSAIYRSAREREGLLEKISSRLDIQHTSETEFIQGFRNIVADEIVRGNLPSEREGVDAFTYLSDSFIRNNESFNQILQSYPSWFKQEFSGGLGERDTFVNVLSSHSRRLKEWVGEIEVRIVKELLKPLNISIEVRSNFENTLYKRSVGNDVLHLYNRSEQHYEYFSFMEDDSLAFNATNVSSTRGSESAPTNNKGAVVNIEATAPKEPLIPAHKNKPDYNEENESDISIIESSLKYKYDPENGNQVSDRKQMILLLKRALKDLEKEESAQEKQGEHALPTNLYELLINFVLNDAIDLSTILSLQFTGWNKTRSRTSMFEALWIIVIGLGFIERFPIENIELVDWRNVNKEQAPEVFKSSANSSKSENIVNILKSMPFGTRAGGVSDITFYFTEKPEDKEKPIYKSGCGVQSCQEKKTSDKVYISSVKFFELDIKKNIDKFDIAPLIAATEILTRAKQDYEILLFVKDNKAVSNIVDQARKRYLANKVKPQNIFGETFLLSSLYSLRNKVIENMKKDMTTTIQSIYGKEVPPKSYLQLRFHQELIVEKTYNYVNTTKDTKKTVLIGVLPRGGKTYICGGIVSKLKPTTVLVLTHVPKETNKQFINDLFNKFEDFSEYTVKYLKDDEENEDYIPGKKYIIFTSYQLLKMGYSAQREGKEVKRKLLKALVDKSLVPDLCFLDEAHFGSGGNEAKEIYKQFDIKTIRILMTATYRRPYYLFDRPTLFFWDYQDIQCGKRLNNGDVFDIFRKKHLLEGENPETNDTVFDRVLENQRLRGNGIEQIQEIYSKFPDIETIDSQFEETAKQAFQEQLLDDGSKGFSMEAILAVNPKKDIPPTITEAYTLFTNPGLVGKFLNYVQPRTGGYLTTINIEGRTADVEHIEGNLGNHFNIMDRIYNDSELAGNRLNRDLPHTQIWFIPPSNGIQKRILALASLLLSHPWFRERFCVIGVSGGESDKIAQPGETSKHINIETFKDGKCLNIGCANSSDLKECIEEQERINRCANPPKGTIILTGYMLRMGISLGCADVVMMFDDDTSEDATTQKRYRALTESEGKKKSYVVDLNPRRSIRAMCNEIEGVKQTAKEPSGKIYQTVINTFGINTDRFLFASPGGKVLDTETLLNNIERENESMSISKNMTKLEKEAEDLTKSFDDAEINEILRKDFDASFMSTMNIKLQKERKARELNENDGMGGKGRRRVEVGQKGDSGDVGDGESVKEPEIPIVPVDRLTPEERFKNFKRVFDTTLKIIAFTYNAKTSNEVYELMHDNPEVQELVYTTLLSRGLIKEVMILGHKRSKDGIIKPPLNAIKREVYTRINEEQKAEVIQSILHSLSQMTEKKTNYVYRGMKEKADDPSIDQQKILDYINKHLSPTEELKDTYGEVFTPMKLVNEMLDSLEKTDPAIFEDKDKKWLDPANGMGNFPVAVFYRLMKKLKGVSRNPKERAEYIVKNMLYMVELQKENSAKARKIFKKLAPDVDPNILNANTLTEFLVKNSKGGYIKSFGEGEPVVFDVIMGNPPFNPPKGETGSSGNHIWANFVMKSYSLLKEDGYLLFVHPPGWKKPLAIRKKPVKVSKIRDSDEEDEDDDNEDDDDDEDDDGETFSEIVPIESIFNKDKYSNGKYDSKIAGGIVWRYLKEYGTFKYIYTNDQKTTSVGVGEEFYEHFPSVDYYVYNKNTNKTPISSKNIFNGNIYISNGVRLKYDLTYLPNLITRETLDILTKITSKKGKKPRFRRHRAASGYFADSSKGRYKYIYEYKKDGSINYQYSNNMAPNLSEDKVVMTFGGGIDKYYVDFIKGTDEIGSFDSTMYSKVDNISQGIQLRNFFKSDIVYFIFLITQYSFGKRPKNESLVANSLTIPPNDVDDYYVFFDIVEYKDYIKDIIKKHKEFKPTKAKKPRNTEKKKKGAAAKPRNATRKIRRT